MEIVNWILIITITIAMGLLFSFAMFLYLKRMQRVPEDSTEQRIQRLSSSLIEAVKLIGEMEEEVNSKHSVLEKLRKDIETNSQISTLKKQEIEAVTQMVRREFRVEGRRSFRKNIKVHFVFFLVGAFVSGLIQWAVSQIL